MPIADITYTIYGKDKSGNPQKVSSHTFENQEYSFNDDEPREIILIFNEKPSIDELGGSSYYVKFPEKAGCTIKTDDYDGVESIHSTLDSQGIHQNTCKNKGLTYHSHELEFKNNNN